MDALILYVFGAAAFMPHGYCLLWRPDLVAMHAISDSLIALAYFSIPAAIFAFVRRRPDFRQHSVATLFILFITLCGVTHVVGVWTLWQPVYGLEGLLKAATAAVSLLTAVLLWPLLPKLLALPSPAQLAAKNADLEAEIRRRELVELALRRAHAELEDRVAERTRELAAAKAAAEHLAMYDQLTEVANRRLWQHRLDAAFEESRRSGRPFALVVVDLDNFKGVNDRYGHPVGDALLVETARRLRESVRGHDLVARLGGDEFAILAATCDDAEAARSLADRLILALALPFELDGRTLRPIASVGVTMCSPEVDDAASLIARADHAAYVAKRAGGGRFEIVPAAAAA